jgi:PKD repeat protein
VSLDASASSDPAGVASYRWDFGDGTGASGPSPTVTHSYSQLGNYTVTLTVTNSKGYTGTSQQWFSVTGPLHADFTFSPASPQPGQPVSFYDGSSDPEAMIASYSWSFGDGSTGSGPMPQHAYAQPGAYTTSLTVTDAYGRTDSVSHTVTVKPAQTSGGGGNGGSGGSGSGGTGGGLPPPPSGGSGGTQPPPTSGGDGTGGSGGGGGSSSSPTLALSLTQAHQLHRVWREPSVRASRSAKAGPPVGTEFWFVLNEQAHVSFAFTREAPGRVLGGRCQSPRHPSRHARACLRDIREGTLEMPGRAGPNNLLFLGQVSRSRWLPPGQYTLALTATNSAGEKSGRLLLRFRIAP